MRRILWTHKWLQWYGRAAGSSHITLTHATLDCRKCEQSQYMRNFNVRYECLDAQDDYQAQMMKDANSIVGSWVKEGNVRG